MPCLADTKNDAEQKVDRCYLASSIAVLCNIFIEDGTFSPLGQSSSIA